MIEKYDEQATIRKYERIEQEFTLAIQLALKSGAKFWSLENTDGIGIVEAYMAAYPHSTMKPLEPLRRGIAAGFYGYSSYDLHADVVIGRKIGERLRKLVP